nr:hypothetical protein [uncultured Chryseobacterium sp.]
MSNLDVKIPNNNYQERFNNFAYSTPELLNPGDHTLVLIDQEDQMIFPVESISKIEMTTFFKKTIQLIVFALLPMLVFGQKEVSPVRNNELSEKEVSNVILNYGKILQEGNVIEILKLYLPDAEIIPDGLPSLSGTKSIKKFYEETFSTIKIGGTFNIKEVKLYGNLAIVRCEQPAVVEILENSTREKSYFRELFILVRNPKTKKWKIQKYMFSQNKSQS